MTGVLLRPPAELEKIARRGIVELEGATAAQILEWGVAAFGRGLAVSASMQDTVLAHLASKVSPGIDVIFLDTGYHFVETLGTADAVGAVYDVTLRRVRPELTVAEQDARYGPQLHDRDPNRCCVMRKVAPLTKALQGYEAWATGVRRAESPSRAHTAVISFDPRKGKVAFAPLASWTDVEVGAYARAHGVLMNPLLQLGYPSIGCEPCTATVAPGQGTRAGRWSGSTKTECGLHL
ncbi:MAG: phosphoadenylyl-sulfate reductase [Nakamurella sp.]